MKRFQKSFIICIMIMIFSFESNTVYAETIYSQDYFNYYIEEESVIISDYFGSESEVTVPAMIAGYPVSGIATGAFSDSNTVTHVNLPDTIMEVQSGAIRAGITVTYNSNTDHPQGTLPEMKESENNSQNTNTPDSSTSNDITKKEDTTDNKISDTIENGNVDFSGNVSSEGDQNIEMSISGGQVSKEEMEQIAAKQEEIDRQRESEKNLDLVEGTEAAVEAEILSETESILETETEITEAAETQSETEAMTESELESETVTEEAADSGKDFSFAAVVVVVIVVLAVFFILRRKK